MTAAAILDRLDETRNRWWLFSLLCGVVLALTVSLAAALFAVLADAWLQLSRGWLIAMSAACIAVPVLALASLIRRVLRRERSLAAAARRVELSLPELGSDLINLVQLSQSANGAPESFRQAAVAEAAARLAPARFAEAAGRETRWRRFVLGLQTPRDLAEQAAVLVVLVSLAGLLAAVMPQWSSSTSRLLRPWQFVPQVGKVKIVDVQPGNVEVPLGAKLDISARIVNPRHAEHSATIFVSSGGKAETARPMLADEGHERFSFSLPEVAAATRYRLEIGDSQTEIYTVGVQEKPKVERTEVTYVYPPYLKRPDRTLRPVHGDLEAPQYTLAKMRIYASSRLSRGEVHVGDKSFMGTVAPDSRTLLVDLLLTASGDYTVRLFSLSGYFDPQPPPSSMRVEPDAAPTIQIARPVRESQAARGSRVPVLIRAADDHGLGEVRLEIKVAGLDGSEGEMAIPDRWTFQTRRTACLKYDLDLDSKRFRIGETVLLRAVASDRRRFNSFGLHVSAQESAGPWHRIRLVEPEARAGEALAQADNLRAKLWAILRTQIRARTLSPQVAATAEPGPAARLAHDLRKLQIDVQQQTAGLAEGMQAQADDDLRKTRRVLNRLAQGEMLDAVRQAETLARVAKPGESGKPVAKLAATQDQIIAALRRLLDMARAATVEALAQLKDREGGDLPNDVQDKLRALQKKLEEFLKQQKKVIEASEDLAKMPVEDFTEKEEQLLKELAAAEDDWSRFMAEAHTDLSKLPEQDLANPSLLEELVEVQTELKMAEDALTKKTADIAVPLEQLGAEMAEEMTTNIEKWLPDTPDREKWSQEEPLSDDMKEAPMAELPGELEDIVGDLMEEEEDLFDEMEDVSSSWADSIDKGAGWDAMDGPISNMSARGVTGNRLPNSSEISGRSGEGRQGKASGEFVGDTAVGKGGRKTPSRLTPDPFVKGQIKDYSKDPVGGATGGGKESGQGGEGLEGPVPNRPQREMQRLAGKQAALRNKAESIDLKFQVMKYHHNDLKEMIQQMAAVERDLRGGRYRSALRRRDVLLKGLEDVQSAVEGEIEVREDQTANVPGEIQKEILNSSEEPSPRGWEELNRKYFEQLATGGKPAAAAEKEP